MMALIVITLSLSGCLGVYHDSGNRIEVVTSILPQVGLVESIGGDRVKVTPMVATGADPHSSELIPSKLQAMSSADIYLQMGSGIEFEALHMNTIIGENSEMEVVNCSQGIEMATWGEHLWGDVQNNARDPHVWLSPLNMIIMAQNMYNSLMTVDPQNQAYYADNLQALVEDLEALHQTIDSMLAPYNGTAFLSYHPSWGYFSSAYGLKQISIQKEGQEPGPMTISKIVEQAKEENITALVVSPNTPHSSAEVIAEEIDGTIITADPLAEDCRPVLLNLASDLVIEFGS